MVTLRSALSFTHVRRSLGYVDDEAGRIWSFETFADIVDGDVYPKAVGSFDRGANLPLPHSSIWIRTAAGVSGGDRTQPFANFFFGGFGNNYVDHGDEKRYRHVDSFPGAELNEIPGRNFVKATGEWNLPPWRFRRVGTPGLYATWLRPSLFATGLTTNVDDAPARRTAATLGGQVDLRFTVLSNQDMTLSLGAAVAVEDGYGPRRELMFSLKVLR